MWMSKNFAKQRQVSQAENGTVTMSTSSTIEAISSQKGRSIDAYSPFGYSFVTPLGEDVLLVPSSKGQMAVGTKMKTSKIDSGEVKISSLGGATIHLKNDGSVVINGLVIDSNGVIKE